MRSWSCTPQSTRLALLIDSIGIMSALQTFMLVVDHDKEEAKRIAEGIAHGMPIRPAPETTSNRCITNGSEYRR